MKQLTAILLAATAFCTVPATADKVTFDTTLPIGETLTLALNADAGATLSWDGGEEEIISTSEGNWHEVTVRGTQATIITKASLTRLYIAEGALTGLDVSDAPALQVLVCDDNALTTLDVTHNNRLEELSCSGNRLSTLQLNNNTLLKQLDCTDNALEKLDVSGNSNLETLICSSNRLKTIEGLEHAAALHQLWCNNNALTTLHLGEHTCLRGVVATDNTLASINVAGATALRDIWVSGNALTELSLEQQSRLESLSAADNELATIHWNNQMRTSCKHITLQSNCLPWASLVDTVYQTKSLNVVQFPQRPCPLFNAVTIGEKVDLSALLKNNGWGTLMRNTFTLADATGYMLEAGTDYTVTRHAFTFNRAFTGVTLTTKSTYYKNNELVSEPFDVSEPTGINVTKANDFDVKAGKRCIVLTSGKAVPFRIVNAAGTEVASGTVNGTRRISLPPDVYIVEGIKLVVR